MRNAEVLLGVVHKRRVWTRADTQGSTRIHSDFAMRLVCSVVFCIHVQASRALKASHAPRPYECQASAFMAC